MLLSLACICTMFVAAPIPKERTEAEKLVGTWKLVKSTHYPDGLTTSLELELKANGKLTIRQTTNGDTEVYEGEYKLEKGKMPYKVKLPDGETKEETLTIKKLTEKELHVVDPDGIQEDFERVIPKDKDEK